MKRESGVKPEQSPLGVFMIAVKEVKHMNQEELNTDNSNENNNQGGKGYSTVLLTLFRRKKRRY